MRTGFTNRPSVVYDETKLDRFFAEDLQDIADYINTISPAIIKNLYLNLMLAFFKLSVYVGLVKFNLIDGFFDEYEDQSGVDTVNSINENYNLVDNSYSPTAQGSVPSPYVHYRFNDNAGNTTVLDTMGAVNGTASVNTSGLHVDGKVGTGAFALTALQYISLTGLSSTSGSYTFTIWYKDLSLLGRVTYMFDCSAGRFVVAWQNPVDSKLGFYDGSWHSFGSAPINDGNWHFLALTFNGVTGKANAFIDNVSFGTTDLVYTAKNIGGLVRFNNVYDGTNSGNAGKYDDFRIHTSVLSSTNLTAYYNAGVGIETEPAGAPENMTLISNATIAEAVPSQARIVIFEEDIDAVTLNTNIKAYVSRDGINYTQIILTDEGHYEAGKRIISGLALITSVSGTNIKYKIQTFNNKSLKLHGTAVQWD